MRRRFHRKCLLFRALGLRDASLSLLKAPLALERRRCCSIQRFLAPLHFGSNALVAAVSVPAVEQAPRWARGRARRDPVRARRRA